MQSSSSNLGDGAALDGSSSAKTTTTDTSVASNASSSSNMIPVCVSWSGKSYSFDMITTNTVSDLKEKMEQLTGVLAKRQKIVGLKYLGRPAGDECKVGDIELRPNQKVMMIGSVEAVIAPDPSEAGQLPDVLDDFDYDYWPDMELVRSNEDNQARLRDMLLRVKSITLMNGLRESKKLCVLDLDYTLFDMGDMKNSDQLTHLKRPHLDDFLTRVFVHYDIAIWSQTSWRWLELKLTELGLLAHPNYHISFVMDRTSMFKVSSRTKEGTMRQHEVKALAVIWNVFPQYGPHNTVHVDDLSRNFVMNPKNGIKVAAYKNSASSRQSDNELLLLADFLEGIASTPDITKANLAEWKKTVRRR